jgi:hypothetical protein
MNLLTRFTNAYLWHTISSLCSCSPSNFHHPTQPFIIHFYLKICGNNMPLHQLRCNGKHVKSITSPIHNIKEGTNIIPSHAYSTPNYYLANIFQSNNIDVELKHVANLKSFINQPPKVSYYCHSNTRQSP